jgi:hypothetical protein
MICVLRTIVLTTIILGTQIPFSSASEKKIPHYHNTIHLVQRGDGDYHGPWYPSLVRDQLGPHEDLDDSSFFEVSLLKTITPEVLQLNDFWFKELNREKDCPNADIAENGEYIRYLYRLVTLSYMFETLGDYAVMLNQLGDTSSCSLKWEDLFKKCTGDYEEMVKFLSRAKGRTLSLIDPLRFTPLNRIEQESMQQSISDLLSQKRNPRHGGEYRLLQNHLSQDRSPVALRATLKNLCRKDQDYIQKICSEQDRLYGLSKIPQARLLVEHSNAMTVLRQKGHSNACLGRFTELYVPFEEDYTFLQGVFQYGMQAILERKARYRQGALFLLGALKEFDDQGLADVLKPISEVEQVEAGPKSAPVVVAIKPTTKTVTAAKAEVAVIEKPVQIELPKSKRISQFELAVKERSKTKANEVAVNMQEMKQDFLFNEQLALSLSAPMQQFQTRKALSDMKKFDQLGSKKEPVRLIFIKFLIDHDFHQGLFNITAILGENFWVVNDIDKTKDPEFIRLQNDATTNNRWQIYVMAPPKEDIDVINLK